MFEAEHFIRSHARNTKHDDLTKVTFSGGALDGLQRMIPVRVGLTWFSRLADVPLIESIIWAHKLASLQLAI